MGRIRVRREGPFAARGDDGRTYGIYHVRRFSDTVHTEGIEPTGLTGVFETGDGRRVTRLETGVYRLDGFDTVIIRSDDPNAP